MRQRGLSAPRARALLIESFLAEPLDGIADETLREALKAELRQRLEALS
jgi:Fe-S cluster assembly protein SufD